MHRLSSRQAGVLVSYAYSIAQILVQLLYVPILLNGIGQSEYGLYQFVGSVMAYLTVINNVLAAGITKFYSRAYILQDQTLMENTLAIAKRLYWLVSVVAVLAILALGTVVSFVYSGSFDSGQIAEVDLMFVVLAVDMIVVMNNTINIAVITANEKFVFLRLSQLLTAILQPVLVVIMMQLWSSAVMVCVMTLACNLLCAVLQRVYAQSALKTKYTYHGMDKGLVKELLAFSSTVILVALSDQIFWKSGQLILGFFYGPDLIAVFAIGAQIYSVYMALGTSVATVFLPRITDIYLNSIDRSRELSSLFIQVGRISFYITFLVLAGFAILGEEFVSLWAGEKYRDAYWVALIVMVPFTIDIIQNLGLTILQVADKYQFRGYLNIVISAANVALSIFLASEYGVRGVAFSTAISMFIGNGLVMNWYYGKKIGLDVASFWRSIMRIGVPLILVSAFAGCVWQMIDLHGWISLIIAGAVFVVAYGIVAVLLCFNNEEKMLLFRKLGKNDLSSS